MDWQAILSGGISGGLVAILTEVWVKPWVERRKERQVIRNELRRSRLLMIGYASGVVTAQPEPDAPHVTRQVLNQVRDNCFERLQELVADLTVAQAQYGFAYEMEGGLYPKVIDPFLTDVWGVMLSPRRGRDEKAEFVHRMTRLVESVLSSLEPTWPWFGFLARLGRIVTRPRRAVHFTRAIMEIQRMHTELMATDQQAPR